MKKNFGAMPNGSPVSLYTISCGKLTAEITDLGATLVRLLVPDTQGNTADVVLGFDSAEGYLNGTCFLGATVGRNANRIGNASFSIGGKEYKLAANEGRCNLHSGLEFFHTRLWDMVAHTQTCVKFHLSSPDGDQGFPGNAEIDVTYTLDDCGGLHITYDAVCDQDTVFNMTNHSYFNLAGHDKTDKAMEQLLTLPARYFTPDDAENIPTGEERNVEGTPFDFRSPKPIGLDIGMDYDQLHFQGGFDHNFEASCNPCAILEDPVSGRVMTVDTDCPGIQLYAGNFLTDKDGKDGVQYTRRSGICLESQFFPDCLHKPQWVQPITKAGEKYHSETVYRFNV